MSKVVTGLCLGDTVTSWGADYKVGSPAGDLHPSSFSRDPTPTSPSSSSSSFSPIFSSSSFSLTTCLTPIQPFLKLENLRCLEMMVHENDMTGGENYHASRFSDHKKTHNRECDGSGTICYCYHFRSTAALFQFSLSPRHREAFPIQNR